MHISLEVYNDFDSHDGHDSHNKFLISGQAGKGLILSKDLLLADASMVFHLQQCRHMVYKEGAYLDNLHSCKQPFDPKKLVTVTLKAYD